MIGLENNVRMTKMIKYALIAIFLAVSVHSINAQSDCWSEDLFTKLKTETALGTSLDRFQRYMTAEETGWSAYQIRFESIPSENHTDALLLDVDELKFLEKYVDTSSKKPDEIIKEIKNKGGYDAWKKQLEDKSTELFWKTSVLKAGEKSYKDAKLIYPKIGYGDHKETFLIEGEPDKVIIILKKEVSVDILNTEIEALKVLSGKGYPTAEILQKTTHNGQPAMVMKRYKAESHEIINKEASPEFLTLKSIEMLSAIQEKMKKDKIIVSDLQFLIAEDGSVVIADPRGISFASPTEDDLLIIKMLIYESEKLLDVVSDLSWSILFKKLNTDWNTTLTNSFKIFIEKKPAIRNLFIESYITLRARMADSWRILHKTNTSDAVLSNKITFEVLEKYRKENPTKTTNDIINEINRKGSWEKWIVSLDNPSTGSLWEFLDEIEGWDIGMKKQFKDFIAENPNIEKLLVDAIDDKQRIKIANSWELLKDYPEYCKNPDIIKSHAVVPIIGSYDDTQKPLQIDKLSFSGFEDDMSKIKKHQKSFSSIGFFIDNAIKVIELPDGTFKILDKSSYYRYRALQEMGLRFVPVKTKSYTSLLELVEDVYRKSLEIDLKNPESQQLISELVGDSKNISIWKILYHAEVDESIRLNHNNEFFVVGKFMEENSTISPDEITRDIKNVGWEKWTKGDVNITNTGDYAKINLKGLEVYRKASVGTQYYEKSLSYAMIDPQGKPMEPFMLCYLNNRTLTTDLKEPTTEILKKLLDIKTLDNAFTKFGGADAIDVIQIVWKKGHPDYDVFKNMIEEKMTIKEALMRTTVEHWAYLELEHIVLTKTDDNGIEFSIQKEISGNDIFSMVPGHDYEDALIEDAIKFVDLRDALEVNPDLIDAWVILKNAEVAEEIRGNINILSLIDNHFDEKYVRIGSLDLSKEIRDMGWDKWVDTYHRYENPILIEKIQYQLDKFIELSKGSENKICINWVETVAREKDVQKLSRIFGLDPAVQGKKIGPSGKKYIARYPNIHIELDELLPRLLQLSNKTERKPYEVYVQDGKLMNDKLGNLLEFKTTEKNPMIFVLDKDGRIYSGVHENNVMQHSSFLSGAKVVTAGQFHYYNGKLIIDRKSGHYIPKLESLEKIVAELTTRGVNILDIIIETREF